MRASVRVCECSGFFHSSWFPSLFTSAFLIPVYACADPALRCALTLGVVVDGVFPSRVVLEEI